MSIILLERHVRYIGLESSVADFNFSNLKARLPDFISDVSTFFKNTLSFGTTDIQPAIGSNKTAADTLALPYPRLMASAVYVSPGQSADYVDVADALVECQKIAGKLLDEVVYPFNKWVVQQLSDPAKMVSFSNGHVPNFKTHNYEAAMRGLMHCFKNRENVTEVTYGDVFKKSSDYAVAANRLGAVQADFAKIPVDTVKKAVGELTENLEKLVSRMSSEPDVYKPNGPTIKTFSAFTLHVAKECSFYSAYAYKLQSVVTAFLDSERSITEHIEKNK